MKRLIAFCLLLSYLGGAAQAEESFFKAEPQVIKEWGKLKIYNPFTSPRVVYLRTLQTADDVAGGEVPLASYYILEAVAGIGASLRDGSKNGFTGGNLYLPNPLSQLVSLASVRPGLAGGYNFDRKEWYAAL